MADPTEEPGQEPDPESPKGLRAALEAANERARAAEAKTADFEGLQRKLAIHEAGLGTLDEKQVKALFAVHEGDADAAGLQATAKALFGEGVKSDTPVTPQTTPSVPDNGLERMEQFGTGGQSGEPPPSGRQAFEKQLAEAKSEAEFDAVWQSGQEFLT